ncbi:alpha amylase [Salpingoeca rosetta]|uniref:Alpha amylase n=1 Tax=Salpingoeca rosetta (strain ATCC 50818 / BSB-021) TaxID=946362 RepID=F2UKT9_SALR5|nr:alpha amylase [Salpingoeca rosetta]EGD77738.1 alpha amylase [Salpingoeca rosetta]|eukprot:XP_004990214.1 alpha amylase [Salpingoeca rosetta]
MKVTAATAAIVATAVVVLAAVCAASPTAAASPADGQWWQTGIVYQIYPRSFLDACSPNCTGTGSLRGIERKLQYLRDTVGVNAIWISPIYESPMADFGYDISNYTAIWPTFGTMEDFDNLIAAAKKLGIHVLMDFVPNHTSNQHPWFLASRSNKTNPYRDWYVWRQGRIGKDSEKLPPNNWRTIFCPDANCYGWTYDNATDEWYYHCFLTQQPDLNWTNPDVVSAMHDVLRFWLRKGVDGFRVDAFPNILEDPQFRDEPLNPNWHGDPVTQGYEKLIHIYTENQPGLHDIVRGMRKVVQEFGDDKALIGEIYPDNVITEEDVISFYGTEEEPEFSMPFNMNLISFFDYAAAFDPTVHNNPRNASRLREIVDHYNASLPAWAQPNFVLGNHDVRRLASRLNDTALTRVANTLLFTLRGTPTMYNGDEFGQKDGYVPPGRRQDPNCKTNYTGLRCRDPERTPLQWDTSNANAGFSGAGVETWLPVSSDYVHTNAAAQMGDPTSMLDLVSRVIALRTREHALHSGLYQSLDVVVTPAHLTDNVFAFLRYNESNTAYVVVANLADHPVRVQVIPPFDVIQRSVAHIDTFNSSVVNSTVNLSFLHLHRAHAQVVAVRYHNESTKNTTVGVVVAALLGTVFMVAVVAVYCKFGRAKDTGYAYTAVPDVIDER